ncbi:MAG: hypothetical protein IRZ06_12695, partial [Nevskia sp.]|nr:hypothetical protein [Nevskia sp.]
MTVVIGVRTEKGVTMMADTTVYSTERIIRGVPKIIRRQVAGCDMLIGFAGSCTLGWLARRVEIPDIDYDPQTVIDVVAECMTDIAVELEEDDYRDRMWLIGWENHLWVGSSMDFVPVEHAAIGAGGHPTLAAYLAITKCHPRWPVERRLRAAADTVDGVFSGVGGPFIFETVRVCDDTQRVGQVVELDRGRRPREPPPRPPGGAHPPPPAAHPLAPQW